MKAGWVRLGVAALCVAAPALAPGPSAALTVFVNGRPAVMHADRMPHAAAAVSGTPTYTCFGNGVYGKRVRALYIWTSQNKLSTALPTLTQLLGRTSPIIDPTGTKRVRFVHGADCKPTVKAVHLTSSDVSTLSRTIQALGRLGYANTDRKYVMFVESSVYCGIATVTGDSSPGATNRNNTGSGYARIDRGCWYDSVVTHELGHTLGAVQLDAPHATQYWHCNDEQDVMCYADGPGSVMQSVCPTEVFDCNNDDYFSLHPTGYLANHWNIANSSFLG